MSISQMTEHRVTADLARTWLLQAGDRPVSTQELTAGTPDQIIFDLEDGVDDRAKVRARNQVRQTLRDQPAWVRLNPRSSSWWANDVTALRNAPGLLGVVLAKAEDAESVRDTVEALGGRTLVIPLIETAVGIESAVTIAQTPGVFRLAFGSGDYRRDTGTADDPLAMAYPRSRLVVASRVARLPGPIDGPTVSAELDRLSEDNRAASTLGMTGRLCLRLDQLAVVNEAFAPSADELSWAHVFLEQFESGRRTIENGSDRPNLSRAAGIRRRAAAFGISVPS